MYNDNDDDDHDDDDRKIDDWTSCVVVYRYTKTSRLFEYRIDSIYINSLFPLQNIFLAKLVS